MAAYWVQGVLSLTDLATSFYFKDLLHASPASLQVATSIAYLPWTLKPLYGFCTDTVPLLGRKRKSYLMLAALVATACFALLAILPASSGVWLALSIMLAAAIALSDVVVDGLVVERSRGQPQEVAGGLQSLCWGTRYAGAIVTSWVGGAIVQAHGPRTAFGLSALFPLSVAAAALLVQEEPFGVPGPSAASLCLLLGKQGRDLWSALKQPMVLRPTAFLVFTGCLPTAGAAMFFFFTEHLHFSAEFLGHMQTVGYLAAIGGITAYNLWCKRVPLRRLLAGITVVSLAVELARLMLITGANRALGVSDRVFAVLDSSLLRCLGELAQMPLLVLAARLCPPGLEATLFAALMSLLNGAGAVGELLGGTLTALLGVTASDVSHLWLLLVLTSCSMLVTLPLLRLLPEDLDSLGGHPHAEGVSEEAEGAPLLGEGPGNRGGVELVEPTATKRGHTP